ncbi:DUF6571 family protein [Streptomyces sp. SID11385]|uniref:DUF6571 family protein n=1 Tax=Streptomyces sp. SID11385 TaxID=2706031 RepID=UPI0013C577C2|nr:DUF6571 family protein [Streptomyces sp. SID11385]NEA43119.1 hypothetical protein [Streptomyces sp. SID11385]
MDPDATSGNFSGIDPDRFKKVIASVEHGHETLRDRALYFKNQLASYGIGQTELQGIAHSASWASDELPMLKRRYHLSLAEGAPGFAGHEGMVRINEALVNPAAVKEAKKAAKRAAALAKKDPKDLSATEFDELNTLLADNRDEYPFAETFAAALGAKGTLLFWDAMSNAGTPTRGGGGGIAARQEQLGDFQRNLSLTLAAATNSDTLAMKAWKRDMIALGGKRIREGDTAAGSGPDGFVVMSNLMRYGDFDDAFLTDYGKALVTKDRENQFSRGVGYHGDAMDGGISNHVGNDLGNDPMTGFMKALANSPDAATKFFAAEGKDAKGKKQSNFTYLFETRKWPDDSAPGKESVTGLNSLGHALEAATTGHRPGEPATAEDLKHSKAQAELFRDIVHSVAYDRDRLLKRGFLSDSMANMSAEYMPDLKGAISSDRQFAKELYAVTGVRAPLKQDEPDAALFLYTVGKNKEGFDRLNVGEHAYSAQLMQAFNDGADLGHYPRNREQTIDQLAYDSGYFQGIIIGGKNAEIAHGHAEEQARSDGWKEGVSTWGGTLVGTATGLVTSRFTGPGSAVAGDLAGTAADEVFNGIVDGFGKDGKEKEQVYEDFSNDSKVHFSVLTTVQEAAKAATHEPGAASRAGTRAGEGLADAKTMVSGFENASLEEKS